MSFQKNLRRARRFASIMKLGAWLQNLPNKLTPPPFRLMQISSAFWQSRALYVAARLDIAGALGDATLSADDIAARVGADADATARLLRLLVALGIFAESGARTFRNNRLSVHLCRAHPQSVRAMILMHNAEMMCRPWFEQLEQGVRQGRPPFLLTHGQPLFAYLDQHQEADRLFSAAMDSVEALAGDSFACDFDWGRFDRLIDVGGSRGHKSLTILKRHAALHALVVDRPQVIADARRHWADHPSPAARRMHFAAGDLFTDLPCARDARDIYLVSAVLHAFDERDCITALRTLARASGHSGARIAIMEIVLPNTGTDLAGASFDMQMFMGSHGRERTLAEWLHVFAQAGMHLDEVVETRSFAKILVLSPKPMH